MRNSFFLNPHGESIGFRIEKRIWGQLECYCSTTTCLDSVPRRKLPDIHCVDFMKEWNKEASNPNAPAPNRRFNCVGFSQVNRGTCKHVHRSKPAFRYSGAH